MSKESIAIIGMSCRFPQGRNLHEFWQLLLEGKNVVTEIPAERWNIDDYYDADPTVAGKTQQRHAAMLDKVFDFDPLFFNISPAEAIEMNPSQKLILELAWEAMEHSRIPFKKFSGSRTGVFIGNIWTDFESLRKLRNSPDSTHSAIGQSSNIIANRVSYTFGFRGPSLVVDTGCSSALVALHLACQSLWDGSAELSIAGGVNHILNPEQYSILTKFGGLSVKGSCSAFDSSADGFVRGEGAGILLMKRLSDAERDGDHILAVIRGSAINNNGYNINLPATSVEGQMEVLQQAYEESGISPLDVHFIETHGTGTKVGDPTEAKALGNVLGKGRTDANKLLLGSVKTNIGHMEGAAGIAGMIKVILAMQHKVIPKNLHFNNPNPDIPFDELKVKVPVSNTPWPVAKGETMKAGVNSFGWGGTNAHVILEEYKTPKTVAASKEPTKRNSFILPIAAKSDSALKEYAQNYTGFLKDKINGVVKDFRDTCVATALLKSEFDYRLALVGSQKQDVISRLEDFVNESNVSLPSNKVKGGGKIAFVFPGQGSQWLGMGRELFVKEPVFRQMIEACDQTFRKYTDWSLIEQLHAPEAQSRFAEINVIQPTISAIQMSLAALWRSWGVEPDAVVGHSMGEVAAAYTAGAISLDDAAKIICLRSQLMRRLSGKGGGMAVTELKVEEAEKIVQRFPNQLSLAVNNSPKSTVIAGDIDAIEQVLTELESKGLFCRKVKVDVASHSQQMDPLKQELRDVLQSVSPKKTPVKVYSTVLNQILDGSEMNADYWVHNLRDMVQFASVIEKLLQDKHTIFIEVSPHPVLTTAVNECVEHFQAEAVVVPSLRREKPEEEEMVGNLAELYRHGYSVNWEAFYQTSEIPTLELPNYPWQRERYEIEDRSHEMEASNGQNSSKHPLLGQYVSLAGTQNMHHWQIKINSENLPYLEECRVNGVLVLPEAFYLETASAAIEELFGKANYRIKDVRLEASVTLLEKQTASLQLQLTIHPDNQVSFQFHGQTHASENGAWTTAATGKVQMGGKKPVILSEDYITEQGFSADQAIATEQFYGALRKLGLEYGATLQVVTGSWKKGNILLTKIQSGKRITQAANRYRVHPAFIQACLQSVVAAIATNGNENGQSVQIQTIGGYQHWGKFDYTQEVYAKVSWQQMTDTTVKGSVLVYTEQATPILLISDLLVNVTATQAAKGEKDNLQDWLYKIKWRLKEATATEAAAPTIEKGTWAVFGDSTGLSQTLVEKLAAAGHEYIEVTPEDMASTQKSPAQITTELFTQLFASQKKFAGIIHTSSVGYEGVGSDVTADDIDAAQAVGSLSLTTILQSLVKLNRKVNPRLFVVTNGVQTVGTELTANNYLQMPLWGLSKVAANELSQFDCKRIDLSFVPTEEEVNVLCQEILSGNKTENEVAIRGKQQYVSRLVKYRDAVPASPEVHMKADATYLITGFRGLGFVFLEWMFEKGGRHFVLLSRSGQAPADVMQKIDGLRAKGATITIVKADTNDYAALKGVFDTIDATMPPLKGVIHAAGLVDPKTIADMDEANYAHITGPKIRGGWNLHLLTQNRQIDWFVLFSSVSTLFGVSGQASYVAANAFLDGLAYYRRKHGLPAISINWGAIKDVGMLADQADIERYARAEGLEAITMKDAMQVFERISQGGHTQMGIIRLYLEQVFEYYSVLTQTNYLSELSGKKAETTASVQEAAIIQTLQGLDTKAEQVKTLEKFLIGEVARVIKSSASRINNNMTFKGLGIDSLMAVQLRNILEKNLSAKLSVTSFWTHPTIKEYTAFLYEQLGMSPSGQVATAKVELSTITVPVRPETAKTPGTSSGKDVNDMSLDELAQELDDLLG